MNSIFNIMKGIAIVSVVAGHIYIGGFQENFFNQYHLAVFFFVSGYFFNEKYLDMPFTFIWKRIKRLYIPFVILGLFFMLCHNLLYKIHLVQYYLNIQQAKEELLTLLSFDIIGECMNAMWYCSALFFSSIITLLTFKAIRRLSDIKSYLTILLIYVTGGWLVRNIGHSPLFIFQSMMYLYIIYVGYKFRKYEFLFQDSKLLWFMSVFSLLFLLVVTYLGMNARLQLDRIGWYNVLYIPVISIIGCLGVYSISSLMINTKIGIMIAKIGEYSFSIMCLHFFVFKFVFLLQCAVTNLSLSKLPNIYTDHKNMFWYLLYLLFGIIVPIITTKKYQYIFNKAKARLV